MSRGKKLDFFVGATIENGWAEVSATSASAHDAILLEPSKHFLLFKKEKRRGKTVTLVGPFALCKETSEQLLKNLKKKLGCGGSYEDSWMEFQGDIKEKVKTALLQENFRFKHGH